MRLIDADALIKDLQTCGCVTVYGVQFINAVTHRINLHTTVDAVPVVRCKDCKRCYETRTKRNKQLVRLCMRLDGAEFHVHQNDFCSFGKRRSGE